MAEAPREAAVAVAVVSWNTRELLIACLRSMRADADAGRLEVWVVDNGSSDGSVAAVREGFPWVRLDVPGRNLGFGAAVNRVAAATASPWVAPANADIELEPGAIAALLAAGAADRGAGAVAPKLILPDGSVQPSIQPFPSLRLSLVRNLHVQRVSRRAAERLCLRGAWDPERATRADWATGAFMLVRRAAWDAVGGFDAGQWMYSEDLDLCWRLRQAGWAVRYEPRAVVRHVHGASARQAFGDESAQALRWSATNYAWVARRRGIGVAWGLAALNVAGSAARLATATAAERLSGRDLAPVRRRARRGLRLHRLGLRSRATLERTR
jgi:N-acetylglucosaminyl-diphospho-decaprenol L-rhamnosyltransferase